jgi:hypothetical protein
MWGLGTVIMRIVESIVAPSLVISSAPAPVTSFPVQRLSLPVATA